MVIAGKRQDRGEDLISELSAARADGERLSVDEIKSVLLLLLPAGTKTTFRASGNLLVALLSHPVRMEAVRRNRDLLPQAAEKRCDGSPPP